MILKRTVFGITFLIWEHKTGKRNYIAINQNAKKCPVSIFYGKRILIRKNMFSPNGQTLYKPLSRSQAYRIIKEDASHTTSEEAISCHSLRKTFGYYAWQEGVQPALLMNVF